MAQLQEGMGPKKRATYDVHHPENYLRYDAASSASAYRDAQVRHTTQYQESTDQNGQLYAVDRRHTNR